MTSFTESGRFWRRDLGVSGRTVIVEAFHALVDHWPGYAHCAIATLGYGGGPLLSALYWWGAITIDLDADWTWDAFAALSAMSGFALAAMALVLAASDRARTFGSPGYENDDAWQSRHVLDHVVGAPEWKWMLRQFVVSMWTWLLAACLALACLLFPGRVVVAIFLATTALAVARGAIAILAVTALMGRFFRAS